jgi:hypothetical protein
MHLLRQVDVGLQHHNVFQLVELIHNVQDVEQQARAHHQRDYFCPVDDVDYLVQIQTFRQVYRGYRIV